MATTQLNNSLRFFEGDILLPPSWGADYDNIENSLPLNHRWAGGVVPYKIKNTFNQNEIRTIKKAMEEMREENKNYSGKKLLIKNNPIGEGMTMKDLKDHLKTILSQIEVFRLCFFCLEPFPWT